jgi:hypothetical protein
VEVEQGRFEWEEYFGEAGLGADFEKHFGEAERAGVAERAGLWAVLEVGRLGEQAGLWTGWEVWAVLGVRLEELPALPQALKARHLHQAAADHQLYGCFG